MSSIRSFTLVLCALFTTLLVASACETAPPVQEMSDARQAIAVAREAGAEDYASEDLLAAGSALAEAFRKDPESGARMVRETLLADADFGPLCRSLMQLWYLGQWTPLPQDWVRRNGLRDADVAKILSKRSYLEGLAWDAIGAHPMGGKQQGFGAWALPRVFEGATLDVARDLAERIRIRVLADPFIENGEQLFVTVSLGVAVAREDETAEELISRADQAMYEAKAAGKNCVVVASRSEGGEAGS